MATYFARKTGNINASDVWATTPSGVAGAVVFTSSDVLLSNSFTITINVNTTVAEIRTDTTGGATAGGSFSLGDNITITANLFAGSTNNCLNYNSANSNSTSSIVGNITGGSGSAGGTGGVVHLGVGKLNITGSITGGSGGTAYGLNMTTTSTSAICTVTGNITGGSGSLAYGFITLSSSSVCNITGTVTGGINANAAGVFASANSSSITISGTAIGGTAGIGVTASSGIASTIIVTRAKGNGYGNGSVGLGAAVGVAGIQTTVIQIYEIEYGDLGQSPTSGPVSFVNSTTNIALFYRPSLTKKTLVDAAASLDLPATNNVRSGTTYNFGSNTGTCAVPSASSVAFGVAVDNTTGTATLTPSNIWDHSTSSISTADSIGQRLKNAATTSSVSNQVVTLQGN